MGGFGKSFGLLALCVEVHAREQCALPHEDIQSLGVFRAGDDLYDEVREAQYASMLGTHEMASRSLRPAVIVTCSEEAHVVSAINFANRCGYKVTVRSGGHSYTGSSSCNFENCMQLDLTAMNATSAEGQMIKAEPGIKLKDFVAWSKTHKLSLPHGGCTGVGFGGHFQSSAWGFMAHSFGSGMDHIESFRMVLANGSLGVFSKNDTNNTVFRSVLGSAPGSWGIITQYTSKAIKDSDLCPLCSRHLSIRILFSKDNFIRSWRHASWVMKDQEEKNLRDLSVMVVISPPSESEDYEIYITVVMLWTGIDSGNMAKNSWEERYWQPFLAMDHLPYPSTHNMIVPLSAATGVKLGTVGFTNHGDRYAIQSMHSDTWWDDNFTELLADEMVERAKLVPDMYPSFQYLPLGRQTQWARNAGMNSLTWRDTRSYVDDWMFVKNDDRYEEMVERMVSFREKTRKYWQHADGSDRSTWMTPATTYANSTDLRNRTIAKKFFWNDTQFEELQRVKLELDPDNLFSNKGTLPRPQDMYDHVVV